MLEKLSPQDIKAMWAMTLLAVLWIVNCFTMQLDSTLTATVFTIIAGLAGYHVRAAAEVRQRKKGGPEPARE